ncbi:MAG: hypothetical protein QNJ55_25330 [Xenococcus sp. MO_188.B8]|nr:hypothetical protein [Xenococcus sp. MO_188.B8]
MLREESQPLRIWIGLHWSFFMMIQALNICLKRFEQAMKTDNLALAKTELKTAINLMLASGAAMKLAGSFNHSSYEKEVRYTMTPPHVNSNDFSGLMSWDHAILIEIWKRLRPIFANLPSELQSTHQEFVLAYKSLAQSHQEVCSKFGGDTAGSLHSPNQTAVKTLTQFRKCREHLLKPDSIK